MEVLSACVFSTDLVSLIYDRAGFLPTEVLTNKCWAELTSRNKRKQLTGPQKFHFTSTLATHNMVKMPVPLLQMIVLFWSRVVQDHQTSRTMPGTVVKLKPRDGHRVKTTIDSVIFVVIVASIGQKDTQSRRRACRQRPRRRRWS